MFVSHPIRFATRRVQPTMPRMPKHQKQLDRIMEQEQHSTSTNLLDSQSLIERMVNVELDVAIGLSLAIVIISGMIPIKNVKNKLK